MIGQIISNMKKLVEQGNNLLGRLEAFNKSVTEALNKLDYPIHCNITISENGQTAVITNIIKYNNQFIVIFDDGDEVFFDTLTLEHQVSILSNL